MSRSKVTGGGIQLKITALLTSHCDTEETISHPGHPMTGDSAGDMQQSPLGKEPTPVDFTSAAGVMLPE